MKKKAFIVIIAIVLMLTSLASFVACNDKDDTKTTYSVNLSDDENALIFEPISKDIKYGLLFYVGTYISPDKYSYLGDRLAEEGYLT